MLNQDLPGSRIEELQFNLGAGATRNGPTIDCLDWGGSELGDFTDTRAFGWPLLDVAVLPPAAGNILIDFAVNTTPAAAPTLAWTNFSVTGVLAGTWGVISGLRVPARFVRYGFIDTSAAPQVNIYLVSFVRSQ